MLLYKDELVVTIVQQLTNVIMVRTGYSSDTEHELKL